MAGPNPFAALVGGMSGGLDAGGPSTIPNFTSPAPAMDQPFAPPGSLPSALQPPSATSFVKDVGVPSAEQEHGVIQLLGPDSTLGQKTLQKLDAMFKFGKEQMKRHYCRWNANEAKVQAYCYHRDYEALVTSWQGRKHNEPPEPMQVVVPYTYATLHAAATYVSSVLIGRKPIFPLMATRGTQAEQARYMEACLQYNIEASRGQEMLWQNIWDSLLYGFSPIAINWEQKEGPAIRWVNGAREQTTEMTFAGNTLSAVDPYNFVPDPRVPMHQCNIKGDFMFQDKDISETVLLDMDKRGDLKWVKAGLAKSKTMGRNLTGTDNRRRLKIGMGGEMMNTPANVIGFRTLREGTVRLVPKDWGLGKSDRSELWKFTWFEGAQIVQAEPQGMIHQQHPFTVAEPTSFGHDFMSLSMNDMIGPFQDILSWLVSSRMENVRSSINNQFVVDPARVEVNDIRSSTIGRIIRLKQAAMGLPVQEAIQQLLVQDVTAGHLSDIQTMRILADTITGVNDNIRGIQTAGGRRSATEARMSVQAGGTRLSQLAVRISAQAWMPMVDQMILNTQQFMPDSMWMEQTGDDGTPSSHQLTPDMLVGSFNYQVSDGTLPFDKTALVEVWKEILFGIAQDPELRQTYSLPQIFRYVAELGGAKNIDSFKAPPPTQMPIQAGATGDPSQNPNLTPLAPAMPGAPMLAAHAFAGGR